MVLWFDMRRSDRLSASLESGVSSQRKLDVVLPLAVCSCSPFGKSSLDLAEFNVARLHRVLRVPAALLSFGWVIDTRGPINQLEAPASSQPAKPSADPPASLGAYSFLTSRVGLERGTSKL